MSDTACTCNPCTALLEQVRELLKEGRIEEAGQECNAVTEEHVNKLLSDGDAYTEYVAGWELSRKYAVSQAAIDLSGPGKPVCALCSSTFVIGSGAVMELLGHGMHWTAPASTVRLALLITC